MISISIDLSRLDKARFKNITRKNGEKAIFCDLVLFETPQSDYGDYMVKQGITKEDREAGVQLPILGNGKIIASTKAAIPASKAPERSTSDEEGDDIPF